MKIIAWLVFFLLIILPTLVLASLDHFRYEKEILSVRQYYTLKYVMFGTLLIGSFLEAALIIQIYYG